MHFKFSAQNRQGDGSSWAPWNQGVRLFALDFRFLRDNRISWVFAKAQQRSSVQALRVRASALFR